MKGEATAAAITAVGVFIALGLYDMAPAFFTFLFGG